MKKIILNNKEVGKQPILISGPCSVESREHIIETAIKLNEIGLDVLRGGVFKPRTSPYSFQGLGLDGLKYLKEAADIIKKPLITEVLEIKYLSVVEEYADIIQIGARNMYNYPLLKEVAKTKKPVLLKRGLSATIKEWILSAEYLLSAGKEDIILCERGIRSFDTETRNVLDLTAVLIVKEKTNLPVFVDPSHAIGKREYIYGMSKGILAIGADGIMVEAHLEPEKSVSDARQAIGLSEYKKIHDLFII